MERRYILGIDAGATKTHYALYDLRTGRLALLTGRASNHECLPGGYEEMYGLLTRNLDALLACWGLAPGDIAGAGVGMGGVDTRRQHRVIADFFGRYGLGRFALANDGLLGVKAECESGAGVCAINGSGFCVLAADADGHTAQVGGFGDFSGDKGGGSYIVMRGLACVYDELMKGGEKPAMTGEALRLLGASGADEYVEALSRYMEGEDVRKERKALSMMVHDCAGRGDAQARRILMECGREYARSVHGVLLALPALARKPVEIILVGSVFVHASCTLCRDAMEEQLRALRPELRYRIRPICTEPVAGALYWGCELAGVPNGKIPREDVREALCAPLVVPERE